MVACTTCCQPPPCSRSGAASAPCGRVGRAGPISTQRSRARGSVAPCARTTPCTPSPCSTSCRPSTRPSSYRLSTRTARCLSSSCAAPKCTSAGRRRSPPG
eukprot:scaffold29756_cov57-Phaeocystis_antarctica.AAC.2